MSSFVMLAKDLDFPEGPSVARDGAIWLSELRGGRIVRVEIGGSIQRYDVGGSPNGTAFAADGALWFCDAGGGTIRRLDVSSGRAETIIDAVGGERLAAPNDLAFHPDGSLVFTCPGSSRRDPTGYVCRRGPDGHVTKVIDGLLFPNGICFSPTGDVLGIAETYACRVVTTRWEDEISVRPLFQTQGPIGADGVAIQADGTIETCIYGTGVVRSADRDGRILHDEIVPDAHPAGCAVDPLGRWSLLVTGTETGVLLGRTT